MKKILPILLLSLTALCSCGNGTQPSSNLSSTDISSESTSQGEAKPFIDGKKIVVFGDSITAMGTWGAETAKQLNTCFYNAAMGGITTAQGIVRFPSFVPKQNPDFITICFAMNDLIMVSKNTPRVSLEEFEANLLTLINMIKEIGATPILLTTNPLNPTLFWQAQGQDKANYEITGGDPLAWLDMYNDVTRKVASDTGEWLVDMRAEFPPSRYTTYLSDGIHLNGKGNELFAKTLVNSFLERYDRDPNAEPVVEPDRTVYVTPDMGKVSLMPEDVNDWYFVDSDKIKVEYKDGSVYFYNTNGLWPEAMADLFQPISIDVSTGVLNFDIETQNVNASIILFLDGATPASYVGSESYMVLNSHLGCKVEGGSGDILGNQIIQGSIKLSSLPFSNKVIKDGQVKITGIKFFAAGTAYQKVILNHLSVSIPK